MICCNQLGLKLSKSLKKLSSSARLMVGQGDYEAYAQHMRRNHGDLAILTPAEFFALGKRPALAAAVDELFDAANAL